MKRRLFVLAAIAVGLTAWAAWRPENPPSRTAARRDSSCGPPTAVSDPAPVKRIVPAAAATISPPGVARGRVLLSSGEPAVGGWIEYWPNDDEWTRVALDHQARFNIPLHGPRKVLAACDGYGSLEWWIAPGEHEEVVTLGLSGKEVRGRVVDQHERPVAGIRADLGMDAGAAVTDAAGRFVVRGVTKWFLSVRAREGFADPDDAGPLVVRLEPHPSLVLRVFEPDRSPAADKPGRCALKTSHAVHLRVSFDGCADVVRWIAPGPAERILRIGLGGVVEGLVIDPAGKPVAGIGVVCQDDTLGRVGTARAGPDGRFVLRGLPYRDELQIEAFDEARSSDAVRFEVLEGSVAQVVLRVRHQPSLLLRVSDPDDRPVEGAEVVILDNGLQLMETQPGVHRSRALEAGEFNYSVSAPGWGVVTQKTVLRGTGLTTVELRLRDRRTLSGRIVGPAGRPAGGVRVEWTGPGVEPAATTTGADGRYMIRGLGDDEGNVEVYPAKLATTTVKHVTPSAVVNFRLERATVLGVVRPLPKERTLPVWFESRHGSRGQEVMLDHLGRFALFNLPVAVRMRLRLNVVGYPAFEGRAFELEPDERHDLGILELGGMTVVGTVRTPAGRPVAGACVMFTWHDGFSGRTGRALFSGPDGRFEALFLPDTSIRIWVTARGYRPFKWGVVPRRQREIALTLEPETG